MTRFLLRRLGLLLLTLWLMSAIVFVISTILPGDVASVVLGRDASPQAVANLRREWGLDDPAPVQYLHWITGFVTGQWGDARSFDAPIADLIPGRLGNSLLLAAAALVVIVPLSIALGTVAALRQDRLSDRAISITGLSLMAVPEFVSGIILLTVFGIWLHVLPTGSISSGGSPLTSPQYLVLPALALGLVFFGYIARMMRASTISVLGSAYVRTARLKGVPLRLLLARHVLPNALVPTITVVTSQIGYLVGGLVVVETLFGYPGIGSLLLSAGLQHDVPLLEDCVMIIAVIYMLSNLAADLFYAYLNPRVRYSA
jgi:peptide/nickel transport system permease protein